MGKYNFDSGKVLEDSSDSFNNLIDHKRVIKTLIGKINELEDIMAKSENENLAYRAKVNKALYNKS